MKVGLWLVLQIAVISLLLGEVFAPSVKDDGGDSESEALPPGGGRGTGGERGQVPPAIQEPSTTAKINSKPTVTPSLNNTTKCPGANQTNCTSSKGNETFIEQLKKNRGMLQRAVYVLIGITAVVLVYFGLRTWRTRRRKSKTKKYGVITTPASDLEMTPLDQDDDDEDMTVFEVNGLHK